MRVRKEREEMHMASRFYRKCRLLVVGALAISALAASPARARGTTLMGQCWVTPSSVANGSTYTVSGSGLLSIQDVNVYIKTRGAKFIVPVVPVAADGTFVTPSLNAIFSTAGTVTVSIANTYDRKQATLAQCTFTVY